MEVATAYQEVLGARETLAQDRAALLPQARQVLALMHKSYQFGHSGLTDVLVTQATVQEQLDTYYNDVLAYQTALGALERAVNEELEPGK